MVNLMSQSTKVLSTSPALTGQVAEFLRNYYIYFVLAALSSYSVALTSSSMRYLNGVILHKKRN